MQDNKISWGFRDKDHPVWGIMKIIVTTGCVALLLAANASNFDGGEVKTVVGTGGILALLEGLNIRRR